jgi:hypothetical protein
MLGLDSKQNKRIAEADRIDWLTLCAKLIMLKLGEALKVESPPPPPEREEQ